MIYQIADQETGIIATTIVAQSEEIAKKYLEEGQVLYAGGPVTLDHSRFVIRDGALVQRPYVGPDPQGEVQGDGSKVKEIARG